MRYFPDILTCDDFERTHGPTKTLDQVTMLSTSIGSSFHSAACDRKSTSLFVVCTLMILDPQAWDTAELTITVPIMSIGGIKLKLKLRLETYSL